MSRPVSLNLSLENPELVKALQARSAKRLLLNHKRALIWQMERDGILEHADAQHLVDEIEQQMTRMRNNNEPARSTAS